MTIEQRDSILGSVKKNLGISEEQTEFDIDITMHINTVFAALHQMGIGPESQFFIEDAESTWDEFIEDNDERVMVETYVWLKVKLLFDPPTGSAASSYQEMVKEYEWRLNVTDDWAVKDDE